MIFDTLPLGLRRKQDFEFQESPERTTLDRPAGTRTAPAESLLGTPVIDNIRFLGGQYTDRDGVERVYLGLTIDAVKLTVDQQKVIVRTEIAGRNGTVKEYIGDGDYQVSIEGVLFGLTDYPEEEVNRLIALCQVPAAIEVESEFLQRFGILELVISQFNFSQTNEKSQSFTVAGLSDTPFELLADEER